jgi:beta-1,4-mannosyltransferase
MRVLQSVRPPRPTTNPYVIQLVEAVRAAGVEVYWFSWRRALLGGYDVIHVHWPEVLIRRKGRAGRALAQVRFALLLGRCTALGVPIVRTLHNVDPHEQGRLIDRMLIRWCERRTTFWVLLNRHTPLPRPAPSRLIPHGHYADWYSGYSRPAAGDRLPGRILTFGLIRPYKGIDTLLAAFAGLPGDDLSLRVVGQPITEQMRVLLTEAVAADRRVSALMDYLPDEVLAAEISAAQLVVLPYRALHNSGALLLALSLRRPVLVRRSETAEDLAVEVGAGWVHLFDGELSPAVLSAGLTATKRPPPDGPELSGRDWKPLGEQHGEVYREALLASQAERSRRREGRDRR